MGIKRGVEMGIIESFIMKTTLKRIQIGEIKKYSQIPDFLKANKDVLCALAEKLCGGEYSYTSAAVRALAAAGQMKPSDLSEELKHNEDFIAGMIEAGKVELMDLPDDMKDKAIAIAGVINDKKVQISDFGSMSKKSDAPKFCDDEIGR